MNISKKTTDNGEDTICLNFVDK